MTAGKEKRTAKATPGPWFVSGVRFRMNGGEWHSINRYNAATKQDDNIACVGFGPRTGEGLADARLIAAAPELLEALDDLLKHACIADASPDDVDEEDRTRERNARAALSKARGQT